MTDDWFDSAVEDLDERAAGDAEVATAVAWKPDKDAELPETIQGTVFHEIRVAATKYGGAYVTYIKDAVLKDNENNPVIWEIFASRSVLKRELQDASPAVGSLIVMRWLGLQEAASGGRKFHKYQVQAQTPDATLWSKLVGEAYAADLKADEGNDVPDTIATEEDLEKVF
jgi:hypothetical protein